MGLYLFSFLFKLDILNTDFSFGLIPHQYINVHVSSNGLYIFSTINNLQPEIGITFIYFSGTRTIWHKVIEYPGVELNFSGTANNFSIKAGDVHLECELYKLDQKNDMRYTWLS